MKFLTNVANHTAWAVGNNAVMAVILVFMHWLAFDWVEAQIEKQLFGESFPHALDVLFAAAFLAFSGLVIYRCAINNYVGMQ